MKKLQAFLRSLQIFDATNKLSLTSLALMVIIVKLAMAPTLDWTIITTFFLALLNYTGKKLINKSSDNQAEATQSKITSLEDTIKQIKNMMILKK